MPKHERKPSTDTEDQSYPDESLSRLAAMRHEAGQRVYEDVTRQLQSDRNLEVRKLESKTSFSFDSEKHGFAASSENESKGVFQRLAMVIRAGNQMFAVSKIEVQGESLWGISVVGEGDDDRARFIAPLRPLESQNSTATYSFGREFLGEVSSSNPDMSSRHFNIFVGSDSQEPRISVMDIDSTNGTYIATKATESDPSKNTAPISESLRWSVPSDELITLVGSEA